MNRKKPTTFLLFVLGTAGFAPALAAHGPLASLNRDAWINSSVEDLVDSGLATRPSKPIAQLTNFEVVELTTQASQRFAQADLPPLDNSLPGLPGSPDLLPATQAPMAAPVASKGLKDLVEEFRSELSGMGIDVDKLEDKINDERDRNEVFAALQKEYLKRTGTEVAGYSRGFMYNYRGFGSSPAYAPMDYNAAIFMEMDLKSIPVPSLLFDARVRFWRSIGMYYQDPIQPEYQLRWISLMNTNDYVNLNAGDFYKSYTPLTLWNMDAPVYTIVEPLSFARNRKDVEELVYMDHGPDAHLRGFQASSGKEWPDDMFSGYNVQAMVGTLRDATTATYGSYFLGGQGSLSLLKTDLTVKGTGLLLWQDANSASVPYLPNFPGTFAKQYQIASVAPHFLVPFDKDVNVTGDGEWAFNEYDDDMVNPLNFPERAFRDWATVMKASLNVYGFHLNAKYLNIGPNFYSPGAQTNRYTPLSGSQGYLSTNLNGIDDALPGYLNDFPLQDVNRPFFAPYDRLAENALPYGDATPNRQGMVFGVSLELGKGGWLKPQGSYTLNSSSMGLHEIQPNYVLSQDGLNVLPVDGNFASRTFGGYEAALAADLAKGLGLSGRTYLLQLDYKHQTTDLGDGINSFATDTLIGALDFTIPIKAISSMVWSAAYERTASNGTEYFLKGLGNPSSLASYPFYLDNTSFNSNVNYTLQQMDLVRTTLAFGFMLPFSKKINFRGDYFLNDYTAPDRHEHVWRFTYEARY